MRKSYMKACIEAGMTMEQIKEIEAVFNTPIQKMHRDKKKREENEFLYFSYEGGDRHIEDEESSDIPDTNIDLEADYIHKCDLERLRVLMNEMDPVDREFILDAYSGGADYLNRLCVKYDMTVKTARYKIEKIVKTLKEQF